MIDAKDAERVLAFKWCAHESRGKWYARRRQGGREIKLHRFLMDAPSGVEVDHIDGDGLNNRRSNLRLSSHAQNSANQRRPKNNTSGYKGVGRLEGRWYACIGGTYLGWYDLPEVAARAYDTAARERFGEFAALNFPDEVCQVAPTVGMPRSIGVTGYRGVTVRNRPGRKTRWVARIGHQGVRILVGVYRTPEEAAVAFDVKARELFGESAHLNFP